MVLLRPKMMVLSQKSRLDTPPVERCGGSRQWRREDCFFFNIGHDSTAASAPAVKTSPEDVALLDMLDMLDVLDSGPGSDNGEFC